MGRRGRHRNEPPPDGIAGTSARHGDEPGDGAARTGGRAERRRAARRVKRRRRLRATREIPLLIGIALGIALLIKTFLVQAFVIPSGSMEPTININDRVLVDKFTPWFGWEPERGEVVVFKDPGGWLEQDTGASAPSEDPVGIRQLKTAMTWVGLMPKEDEDLIKRVIAIGGDTVACCAEDGRVTVNGTPIDEPYVHPGNDPSHIEFEVAVPPDRIFVMGDHRERSADSRYHLSGPDEGTIPVDQVVGRAVVIAWPYDHWSRLNGSDAFTVVEDP